jgi:hypothetical protein
VQEAALTSWDQQQARQTGSELAEKTVNQTGYEVKMMTMMMKKEKLT